MKNLTLKPGRAAAVLASLALIGAIVTAPADASATGPVTLEATFTSPSYGWSKVERWSQKPPWRTWVRAS